MPIIALHTIALLALGAGGPAYSVRPITADTTPAEAQVARGKALYARHCAECHGATLRGSDAPALAGDSFLSHWRAQSVGDLLYITRTTMPYGSGNSLSVDDYVDIVAYMLAMNGRPMGSTPLPTDPEALKALTVGSGGPAPAVAAAGATGRSQGQAAAVPRLEGPSQADLNVAAASSEWLLPNHDYAGTRYVDLDQITPANAGSLRPVCAYQAVSSRAFHTSPLVYRGVMYFTTRHATIAMDARTCRVVWRQAWDESETYPVQANRGVALKNGILVRGTGDGRLLARDAATGALLWARQVADTVRGESFTMAPLAFEDRVIIGPAGSELGIQGWVGAFRLSDGEQLWRFNIIPKPGEPGAETWGGTRPLESGGGAVWTPMSLDPDAGLVYIAATNPAPDFAGHVRPGADLYTNSLIVLDARTGDLRWYRSMIPHDVHDWDLTQASPLFSLTRKGKTRHMIATAGKDGYLRVLDRDSHEVVYQTAVTTMANVDAPLTSEGVRVCPGIVGGVEWNGPAFSPRTGLLYVPAVDWCTTFGADTGQVPFVPGSAYMGGTFKLDPPDEARGWLNALDAATGKIRWRYHSDGPMVGGVTATSGGVLFTGEVTGDFLALDAGDGRVLYRFNTGGAVAGGVITYTVEGRQYVAAMSGGMTSFWGRPRGSATVFVFGLP